MGSGLKPNSCSNTQLCCKFSPMPPTGVKEEELWFRAQRVRILRRSFQRRLRVSVKANGEVLVTSNRSVPTTALIRFLAETWDWVDRALGKVQRIQGRFPPKLFVEGEEFLFLGQPRRLQFVATTGRRASVRLDSAQLLALVPQSLWTTFDGKVPHPEWREPVRRFYESQGRLLLASRVDVFASLMGLKPTALSFRCQRSRWGSCNSRGRLSLNWRLVAAPLTVIDYVVIHELAHLRHLNHSPQFWQLVTKHCPNHQAQSEWLREHHYGLDFLSAQSQLHR